ncbi:MAG: hypothetical protein IK076_05500, partial [Bacteroidales bacterium]|nr:hypothetical protein [Bacteroidales bacterium]
MKKFLLLLLPLACLVAGCKYDDSDIWSELNSQAGRITSLESLVPSMNSNLISLQNTIRALEQNLTITSVQSNEKGYVISFSDGTTATILNGTNGTNGKDAQTPVIGVKADTDGVYYWTLNGSWLLDSAGKKVSSGSTPRLKVQDDQWYISYDNGVKWTKVEGQNASISSLFKSVTTDARNAYFNLSDGSVITVPLASTVTKLQLLFDESAFQKIRANEVLSTSYEIVAAEGANVDFQTFESDGWTVTIYPTDDRTGRISIKSPEKVSTTKILFLLTDDNGGSFTKIITIGFDDSAKPNIKTQYSVDYQGGELVIPVNSCTATLSEGADWLEVTSVGDQVVLNVTSNDSYDWRQCKLTLEDGTVISITQLTQDALILSESVVQIDGRRQKVNFVVNTNIFVKAEVTEGSDWLSVSPSSRALSEKVFTFTVTRNTTEAERTATIVFSGNDLSETCTVIQAVYDGPESIDVTEAVATDEGTAVELNASYVTGLTTDGYVVTDGDSYIFVKDAANKPELGDSVTFKAVATPFNGVPALASVEEFAITKSTGKITYPTATDITSTIDSYSPSTA